MLFMGKFFFNKKKEIYSKIILIIINILRKGNFLKISLIILCNKGEGRNNIIKYFFTHVIKWLPISRILYNYFFILGDNIDEYFQKKFRKSIGVKKKMYNEKITGVIVSIGKTHNRYYIILKNKFYESFFYVSLKLFVKLNKLKIKNGDLISIDKNLGKINKLKMGNHFMMDKEIVKKSFYFKLLNFRDLDYFNFFTHGVINTDVYIKSIICKMVSRQIDIRVLFWHIRKIALLSIGFTLVDDLSIMFSRKKNLISDRFSFLICPNVILFSDTPIKIILKKFKNQIFDKFIKYYIFFKKKNIVFYKLIKKKYYIGLVSLGFILLMFLVKKTVDKFYCYNIIQLINFSNVRANKKTIRNYINISYDVNRIAFYYNFWHKKFRRNIIKTNKP
uniref:TIP49 P-loop domain-containing protein n=1 Tax=Lotharella vacuolata TaxID=74820 RepID=A0A0H5BKU8_9EUKA|nr:hypothetical protein [Lotharella vacuolata]